MSDQMVVDPRLPQAFLSYAHTDDEFLDNAITWLKEELEKAIRAVTGHPFTIFQDKDGIAFGQHWPDRLEQALENSRFLIPILTPSYFTSEHCRKEAETFLKYEAAAGSRDRILPIYLIAAEVLEVTKLRTADKLAARLHQRQYGDWRSYALGLKANAEIKPKIVELARQIDEAVKRATAATRNDEDLEALPDHDIYDVHDDEPTSTDDERESARVSFKPRSATPSKWKLPGVLLGGLLLGSMMAPAWTWLRQHDGKAGGDSRWTDEDRQSMEAALMEAKERLDVENQKLAKMADTVREPGQSFRECLDCPEMVIIPAGTFIMGSTPGKGEPDEVPQHQVTIENGFAIGRYEVTFAEWDACVAALACAHQPNDEGWSENDLQDRASRPVINVSWDDAQEYVAWLSKKTEKNYRLPSEAEWEYAARAGTTTQYFWGDDKIGCDYANGMDRTGLKENGGQAHLVMNCDDRFAQTSPVGSFKPNAFGLHDTAGNVSEWVEDPISFNYHNAPTDGSARLESDRLGSYAIRGGNWKDSPESLRSANRLESHRSSRHDDNGFRVVRDLNH